MNIIVDYRQKLTFFIGLLLIAGCTAANQKKDTEPVKGGEMKLLSSAFEEGEYIPEKYTADGENISPPLEIKDAPSSTESYALVVDDPDAPVGTWVHWVVWNIPADVKNLKQGTAPEGIRGKNDFGNLKYGGPAPPSGTHRYYFKLYALDTMLNITEGSAKEDLLEIIRGHIVERAEIMGKYSR